jgi:uncharacterized protein YidB (DUF937 family)
MGLRDILIGMQHGPRGQRPPSTGGGGGGGMSPLTMALLALLAYKALKGRSSSAGGRTATANETGGATPLPRGGTAGSPGGLGDILGGLFGGGARTASAGAKPGGGPGGLLPGALGGLLGGAAAGSVLSNGLGNLLKDFQQSGHANVANSWISPGPNQEIAPAQLEQALGSDTLDELAQHSGMPRDELLAGLSQNLPELVDQLTPNGRLPTEQEAAQMV